MNRIDKLLLQARSATRNKVEVYHALIEFNGGDICTAEVYLGDGVSGHRPTIKRAPFATVEAAVEYVHTLAAEYPGCQDVPIIIDDLGVLPWQSV